MKYGENSTEWKCRRTMYVQHTCAFEMNFLNATPSVCIQEEGKKGRNLPLEK